MSEFANQDVRGLIVDLRGNPGGLVMEIAKSLDHFAEPGVGLFSVRGRVPRNSADHVSSGPDLLPAATVAILVDRFTASGGELVALSLRHLRNGLIVGEPTAGHTSVQTVYPLQNGWHASFTTSIWIAPGRARIPASGVLPNVAVDQGPGEIRFTDDVLHAIFQALDRAGRFEQALVVVTADHGDEFFEHGGKGHRRTLFEEVVRVPLVMRGPGRISAGLEIDRQVSLVDVMPTVLSLAGVPPRGAMQGRDLSPLLRGEDLEPAPALLELEGAATPMRALRADGRKLTHYGGGRFRFAAISPADLVEIPLDVDGEGFQPALRDLERMLRESQSLAERSSGGDASAPIESALEQQLRSLGYVE